MSFAFQACALISNVFPVTYSILADTRIYIVVDTHGLNFRADRGKTSVSDTS